ncbi:MAG: hypothetical protein HKN64_05965, partial [Woeseiaceae bacterium]|nr:hypothetical protein [Woeseiaceae bacterium]
YYQIAVLTSLVCFGVLALDFGIDGNHAVVIVAAALAVQFFATAYLRLPHFDPLSPLITSLSLTLLLRTDALMLAAAAAAIAIGSKFLIRINGKHVFNPANVALVSLMLVSDHVWVSSGQWGNAALGAFALACLGFLVLTRARRAETTVAFLLSYSLLLFARALWLGDPLAIPLHQLQNGALLVFAFFMISDPKTTPNTAFGRAVFATLVAGIAFTIQFVYFQPNAAVLALILSSPVVPLIDRLSRGRLYDWQRPAARASNHSEGVLP